MILFPSAVIMPSRTTTFPGQPGSSSTGNQCVLFGGQTGICKSLSNCHTFQNIQFRNLYYPSQRFAQCGHDTGLICCPGPGMQTLMRIRVPETFTLFDNWCIFLNLLKVTQIRFIRYSCVETLQLPEKTAAADSKPKPKSPHTVINSNSKPQTPVPDSPIESLPSEQMPNVPTKSSDKQPATIPPNQNLFDFERPEDAQEGMVNLNCVRIRSLLNLMMNVSTYFFNYLLAE